MPRDSAGNYSLVSGNPVQSGEVISSSWANNTMDDVGVALTDSLDRNGRGGMLAPFRFADGSNLLPGAAWVNETSTGFYRFDGGDLRVAVLTQDVMRWQTSGVQIWDNTAMQWDNILTAGGATTQVPVNIGTVQGQTLRWDETTTKEWLATSALIVDDAGNVGLGTDDPQKVLSVSNAGAEGFEVDPVGAAGSIRTLYFNRNLVQYIDSTNDALSYVWKTGASPLERMRIDSAGNVGIGEGTGLDASLVVKGTAFQLSLNDTLAWTDPSFQVSMRLRDSANVIAGELTADADGLTMGEGLSRNLLFKTANAERMRIDSAGNVGIGTASPAVKLDVVGNVQASSSIGGFLALIRDDPTIGITNQIARVSFSSTVDGGATVNEGAVISAVSSETQSAVASGSELVISTTPTGSVVSAERMRIDSAGNVGIGTAAPLVDFQVQVAADSNIGFAGSTNKATMLAFDDAGTRLGELELDSLFITMKTSGLERMRIDSAGNVGIGTNNPIGKLTVDVTNLNVTTRVDGLHLQSAAGNVGDRFPSIVWGYLNLPSVISASIDGLRGGDITFNNGEGTLASLTERMRIDSVGNVGIGNAAPVADAKLTVAGTTSGLEIWPDQVPNVLQQVAFDRLGGVYREIRTNAEQWSFFTNGTTERMRIDSAGNLLVGKTTTAALDKGLILTPGGRINIQADNGGANSTMISFYNNSATPAGAVNSTETTTAFVTSSDYRLKENDVPLIGALDRVAQLVPKRFNFIADTTTVVDGFFAHEVQEVVPEAVIGEKDGEDMQGIDHSKLVPLLTASIQELTARLEVLENG